ncbi:MAG: DUF3142 domain-containing protein [Akkermansiaceae bacterium]|nr:DUF3142 domain-containing protein [Akkermansiaceae bacterium]
MRFFLLTLILSLLAACGKRVPAPRVEILPQQPAAFWVWHRSSPLTAEEIASLEAAGTTELFWQAVETGWKDGRWQSARIAEPMAAVPDVTIIPVFRIKPDAAFLGDPAAAATFARMVRLWTGDTSIPEIQLDFDCPDRLLAAYGGFLQSVAGELPGTRISITALASWPRSPQFAKLARSVHRMAPMFYDLHPDKPEDVVKGSFRPIADGEDIALVKAWRSCPVPWHAGLPNFERVTVFRPDGKLAGHLRGWDHDAVFFNPALKAEPLGGGVTRFVVTADTTISGNPVAAGSILCHRAPDPDSLAALGEAARTHGASGMLYFTLPGPGIQATHPAPHFSESTAVRPELTILLDGSIRLTNAGTDGIPPRPCDPENPASPGWHVVIESSSVGAFRSGSTGDFPKISVPGNVPPEMSTRLHLHFSKLPPGGSLTSGPLLKAPGEVTWSLEPHVSGRSVKFP